MMTTIHGTAATASTTRYATVTQLKTRLGITDTTDDTVLGMILDGVSRQIDKHCKRHFYTVTETRYFDGKSGMQRGVDKYTEEVTEYYSKLWVDDLLVVTSIAMDSDGDGVWEDALVSTDYILWPWNTWPKLRIDLDLRQGDYYYWVRGQQAIKIVGTWGYGDGETSTPTTYPAPVIEACLLRAAWVWKRKDAIFGVAGTSALGTISMSLPPLDNDVKLLLEPYMRKRGYLGAI